MKYSAAPQVPRRTCGGAGTAEKVERDYHRNRQKRAVTPPRMHRKWETNTDRWQHGATGTKSCWERAKV
eukprot:gene6945-biopygen10493